MPNIAPHHAWFSHTRFGMFIHFGSYAQFGRGEQVFYRQNLDQARYERAARAWNPLRSARGSGLYRLHP